MITYGNNEYIIYWHNNGSEIKKETLEKYPQLSWDNLGWKITNERDFFKKSITWSFISSSFFGVRCSPEGAIFDVAGSSLFPAGDDYEYLAGFLCSKVAFSFLQVLNPTLNFQVVNINSLPIKKISFFDKSIVSRLVYISKNDWDGYETSWDFRENFLIKIKQLNLSESFTYWKKRSEDLVLEMKYLEEENNRLFINAYGLQDELSPEVPEDQITLTRADREKDCQRLISYAIGCMMGRYSLDAPGLIYAHAGNVGFDASRYPSFPADADGILPVTDQPWFADDAAARVREFLHAVWGPDTLEENLAWLAESLGPKGSETPNETIRRYIADKFFKDHLQTYKKRPIYWLFSSGKQGAFQALVYLHRYHEGTLARMRAEYVVPLTGKLQARIDMLQKDALAASSTAARNKLNKEVEKLSKKHLELLAYDEKLRHYADMRITLDLDDGVKVNYGKFGDLLEGVKLVTGGKEED